MLHRPRTRLTSCLLLLALCPPSALAQGPLDRCDTFLRVLSPIRSRATVLLPQGNATASAHHPIHLHPGEQAQRAWKIQKNLLGVPGKIHLDLFSKSSFEIPDAGTIEINQALETAVIRRLEGIRRLEVFMQMLTIRNGGSIRDSLLSRHQLFQLSSTIWKAFSPTAQEWSLSSPNQIQQVSATIDVAVEGFDADPNLWAIGIRNLHPSLLNDLPLALIDRIHSGMDSTFGLPRDAILAWMENVNRHYRPRKMEFWIPLRVFFNTLPGKNQDVHDNDEDYLLTSHHPHLFHPVETLEGKVLPFIPAHLDQRILPEPFQVQHVAMTPALLQLKEKFPELTWLFFDWGSDPVLWSLSEEERVTQIIRIRSAQIHSRGQVNSLLADSADTDRVRPIMKSFLDQSGLWDLFRDSF